MLETAPSRAPELTVPRPGEAPAARGVVATAPEPTPTTMMGMTTEPPRMAGMTSAPVMTDDDGLAELRQFLEQNKNGGTRKPEENFDDDEAASDD